MLQKRHETLYHRGSDGKLRTWRLEQDGYCYRAVAGIEGGAEVVSGWTAAQPKNVGRSNETSATHQAGLEVAAEYAKKLARKYHRDRDAALAGGRTHYLAPMLAQKYKGWDALMKRARGVAVYSQPKLDGIRCLLTREGMFSREGKPIHGAPHVHEAYRALGTEAALDGELYNHELHDDFNRLVSIIRKQDPTADELLESRELVQFHCYDVHEPRHPFSARQLLVDNLGIRSAHEGVLRRVETLRIEDPTQLDALMSLYLTDNYEGQMVRVDEPYEAKRSHSLQKRKEFQDEEFELLDVEEGLGNRSGMAGRATLRLSPTDPRTFGAGIKGTHGFARELLRDKGLYGRATVRFFERTPDGIPRFPVAVAWHLKGVPRL